MGGQFYCMDIPSLCPQFIISQGTWLGIRWTQACRMLICDFQNEKKFHLTIVHYDLSPVGFNDKVKVLFFPLQHEAAFLTLIVRHRPVENVPLALPSPLSPVQAPAARGSWRVLIMMRCRLAHAAVPHLLSGQQKASQHCVVGLLLPFLVISSECKAFQAKQRTETCKERNGIFWRTETLVWCPALADLTGQSCETWIREPKL